VKIIHQNGQSLLQLINDILDLSRIEAERMTVEKTDCHPRQLVDDVLASMRLRAAEKQLSLTAQYDPPLPNTISSDPIRLRQILVNLVGNAIKFTEKGGVKIRVWATMHTSPPYIHFAVTDSGIGVSADALSRIFQPFTQADDSLNRRYGGTGLGLAICRRLAEMLGGTIEVNSTPGRGSTFTLSMVAELLDDSWRTEELSAVCPSSAAADIERPAFQGRVLVADDVPFNRQLICLLLEKTGLVVEQAHDGRMACEMVERFRAEGRPFDMVFMDVQMPVMDGYEATQCMHHRGYSGPIVALTAHATDADRQRCLKAGCDDYLPKPVDRHNLYAILKQHLPPFIAARAATGPPNSDGRPEQHDGFDGNRGDCSRVIGW
jgi:CheY-like chemotaxis protein/anti-sigma regulatory factor (Ser/Thr protein kinase)